MHAAGRHLKIEATLSASAGLQAHGNARSRTLS
jgi:hypothetical protein